MRLSAEQFADLAASFDGKRLAPTQHERRRAGRLELEARVIVRLLDGESAGPPIGVGVRDFSSRGIAILHKTPLQPGMQFILELQRQSGGCVCMLCSVRHSRQIQPYCYRIGAEFTCLLCEHLGPQLSPEAIDAELARLRKSVLD